MPNTRTAHCSENSIQLFTTSIETPLGPVALVAGVRALHSVLINPDSVMTNKSQGTGKNPVLVNAMNIINGYFSKKQMGPVQVQFFSGNIPFFSDTISISPYIDEKLPSLEISLDLGSVPESERRIYQCLLHVPWGHTVTYGELALKAGFPGGARFVGNAMAKNPFPLLIPCHRVIRAGGDPGGFTPGREYKIFLLEMEESL